MAEMRLINPHECPCDGCSAKPCGHPAHCTKFAIWLNKTVEALVLPCKPGTHLWRITTPYRGKPKVTEFVVKNFRTAGKRRPLQLEVQALNVPVTNWMRYQDFYETREEAEAALAKMKEA